jgi:hypothetical protein
LGTTLLFLLTGTNPGDLPQKGLQLQFQEYVQIDQPLKQWLKRMVEPSLDRRFQHAEEALVLLNMRNSLSSMETAQIDAYGEPLPSLVRLERTSEQLNIEVRGRRYNKNDQTRETKASRVIQGVNFMSTMAAIGIGQRSMFDYHELSSIITFFLTTVILNVSLNAIYWIVLMRVWPIFFRTRIRIDRNTYEIIWNLKGFPLYRVSGLTQDLVGAKVQFRFQPDELEVCVLRSKKRQYSFGLGLNPAERKWLVGEIQSWLKQSATGA